MLATRDGGDPGLCDNDAVDHQTVNIEFDNDVTATFTMTAFDDGRRIEIYGTEAVVSGTASSFDISRDRDAIRSSRARAFMGFVKNASVPASMLAS